MTNIKFKMGYWLFKNKRFILVFSFLFLITIIWSDVYLVSSKIENDLEKKGKTIPRFDAMIAAIAINRNAKIYTFNIKHFKNINQIKIFD